MNINTKALKFYHRKCANCFPSDTQTYSTYCPPTFGLPCIGAIAVSAKKNCGGNNGEKYGENQKKKVFISNPHSLLPILSPN